MSAGGAPAARGILLAGSVVFAGLAVARLPSPSALFHGPATPFDRTDSKYAAPAYLFLEHAASVVPLGAVVTVRNEPRDPTLETMFHYYAVGLLPGRRIVPAAASDGFTPDYDSQAEYVLVIGSPPREPPGRLFLSDSNGTVWRRMR